MDNENIYMTINDSKVQGLPNLQDNNVANNTYEKVHPNSNDNADEASTPTETEENKSSTPSSPTQDGNSIMEKHETLKARCKIVVFCALLVSFLCVVALSTAVGILLVKNKTTEDNNSEHVANLSGSDHVVNSSVEKKSSMDSVINHSYREVRGIMLKDLPDVETKKDREATNVTSEYVHCFCLHQDLLYLLLARIDTISVYNYNNFSLWKVIEHKYLSRPTSVHPHTEKHILVTSRKGLLRMTTKGRHVEMIKRGNFFDVNINGGIIAALGNGGVWIYSNTVPIKLESSFMLERQTLTKILIVGDLLYITSKFNATSSIEIYNMTGDMIAKHSDFKFNKVSTPGYYNTPNIRGWDKEGTVLVLDTYWHPKTGLYFVVLKILDKFGNWKVIDGLSRRFAILDIVINDNRQIVVVHWGQQGRSSFTVLNILSTI